MKNFKKLALMGLTAVMSLSLLAACGGGTAGTANTPSGNSETPSVEGTETPAASGEFTTVEAGKLIMSTNAQFPPYEMVGDGEGYEGTGYEGIDVEIAYAIAQKLGLELVVDNMGFDASLQAVQTGKSDIVMAGVTITDDRLEVMDFSDTYANGIQVVIVPENSDIATIDDLEGKLIGCQMGTTGYIYCSDTPENGGYGEDAVIPYDDGAAAIQALMNGQVDCVVIDNAPAQAYVDANPGLKILDSEFANEDYAIGFAKGNTALKDAVNTALSELIQDGTVQSIIDKYIPAEG
ncbi:MAG: ABC transporter substrate-binding protein [Clostridiales bacterium]|uniref:ABC transporter substrate-binding protein n=1 Tax=Flavonifractor porci TaxID=3133422 RepID=UPI0030B0CF21|nr:ABC transporter substrate-binding protein [Clostridiales bacterium]